MQKSLCVAWLVCLPLIAFAQISGVVQDLNSGEPIIGAKVFASDGNKTLTDFDGAFILNCKSFPVTLVTKCFSIRTTLQF